MNEACITGTGACLPGDPVDNEQLVARFGADTPRAAGLLSRTLAANGIKTRHYAVDDSGMTVMLNEELAAEAARRALADRGLGPQEGTAVGGPAFPPPRTYVNVAYVAVGWRPGAEV